MNQHEFKQKRSFPSVCVICRFPKNCDWHTTAKPVQEYEAMDIKDIIKYAGTDVLEDMIADEADDIGQHFAAARGEIKRLQKENERMRPALEAARHELTTLHGLTVCDAAAPSETWTIDTSEIVRAIDEAI